MAWHSPCEAPNDLDEALRGGTTLTQDIVEGLMLRQLVLDVRRERMTTEAAIEVLATLRKASGVQVSGRREAPEGGSGGPAVGDALFRWLNASAPGPG